MKDQIKAVGYIRVSTAEQVKQGESLSTQRKQIKEYADQKGWALTEVYADEGISGSKMENRTEFQKMFSDAKAGKFNMIIFSKLSRFARNAREYLNISYEMEQGGVLLTSIKENIDPTTKTGKLISGILALFAEWEHDTIREQMHENKMSKWREQRTFLGRPPYGYIWNSETKKLEINEKEANIYHRMVDMYLNEGLSFKNVVYQFRKEGIKSKGADWTGAAVSYVLKNPAYYGHYVLNQYEYEDSGRGAGKRRTKRKKPSSENIIFNIPPLISKGRWDEIQKSIEFKKRKSKRSNPITQKMILRDVLQCNLCGAIIKPKLGMKRKDGTQLKYYACFWAATSAKKRFIEGKEKCNLPYIKAHEVENAVWADIKMMFSLNPKKAFGDSFNLEKHAEKVEELEMSIQRLNNDLRPKKKARKNLYEFLTYDDLDHDELRQKLKENKDEIMTIESHIEDTKIALAKANELLYHQQEISEFFMENKKQLRQLSKQINDLDYVDKKRLIEAMLVNKIRVDFQEDSEEDGPGGHQFDYKLRYNTEIIKRFIEEGKISLLDQNSRNYFNLIERL